MENICKRFFGEGILQLLLFHLDRKNIIDGRLIGFYKQK